MKMTNEQLRDVLGEHLMTTTRGYSANRSIHSIEWDQDNPDSQFAIILEDVDLIIAKLEELGLLSLEHPQAMTGVVQPVLTKRVKSLTKTASVTVGIDKHATLDDLEEFVETLKALGVEPDQQVYKNHELTLVFDDCGVERIKCGECGYEDVIIYPADHVCIFD